MTTQPSKRTVKITTKSFYCIERYGKYMESELNHLPLIQPSEPVNSLPCPEEPALHLIPGTFKTSSRH
jgi:hypothetical protein